MSTNLDKLNKEWLNHMRAWRDSVLAKEYSRDLVLIIVPKKVDRIRSRRRRKLAISRLPKAVYKDCYPTSINEVQQKDPATFDVTFNFEASK